MRQKTIFFLLILIPIIFFSGCMKISENKLKNTPNQDVVKEDKPRLSCNKEENCCTKNEDCNYFKYTGECNTPEYVAKAQKEAQEKGLLIGEAPLQNDAACACKNNQCVIVTDSFVNPDYCQIDNDCVAIPNPGNRCYFGYFNKNSISSIEKFKNDSPMMIQDCPNFSQVYCDTVNNKCTANRL